MTLDDVMERLEELGSEQTKNTLIRHGAQEPFFGVKVGDMKKLVKYVKKDRELRTGAVQIRQYGCDVSSWASH